MIGRILWTGALAALYFLFWTWYGGAGKPISPAEADAFFARMDANGAGGSLDSEEDARAFQDRIRAMVADDDGREFFMVNLEQLAEGPEAEAAKRRYSEAVVPLLIRRGSFPVFVTTKTSNMLGDFGDKVDRVAVVRYRSLRDFLDMISHPDLIAGVPDKNASLVHTDVFVSRPVITLIGVRFTLGLLVLLVWLAGLAVMRRFSRS